MTKLLSIGSFEWETDGSINMAIDSICKWASQICKWGGANASFRDFHISAVGRCVRSIDLIELSSMTHLFDFYKFSFAY